MDITTISVNVKKLDRRTSLNPNLLQTSTASNFASELSAVSRHNRKQMFLANTSYWYTFLLKLLWYLMITCSSNDITSRKRICIYKLNAVICNIRRITTNTINKWSCLHCCLLLNRRAFLYFYFPYRWCNYLPFCKYLSADSFS